MKTMNLKGVTYALFALLMLGSIAKAQITTPRAASPAAEVSQTIGISKVSVNYSRPVINGRQGKIWGQLVPYGYTNLGFGNGGNNPWRAGANENTIITFSDDAKIEGKSIAAGSYGLHMAIYENGDADIILSSNTTSWGSFFYLESEDALRVKVKSTEHNFTERLTYEFDNITATTADLALDWEDKRIPFKVEFAVSDIVIAKAKNDMRSTQGFGFQGPLSAAQYTVQNKVALDQGLIWANQAIGAQKNANTLSVKAQVLFASDKQEEGLAIMDQVMEDPTASVNNFYAYGGQLLGLKMNDRAMKVYEKAYKKWENNPFAQHGMAKGYSALGQYKKALKYEKMCLANPNLPANNKPVLEGYVKKLEAGETIN
jgi:tetratricopeptide (TPR) repeat protein